MKQHDHAYVKMSLNKILEKEFGKSIGVRFHRMEMTGEEMCDVDVWKEEQSGKVSHSICFSI